VTTPALAMLARLEDDPLPVLEPVRGQLAVDADAVARWAELVRVDRPYLVEHAGQALRGEWVGAVRAAGRDAIPVSQKETERGSSNPSTSPAEKGPEARRATGAAPALDPVDPAGVGDPGRSRWLKGWRAIHRFVNRFEPLSERALRWWARHPQNPIPVVWSGGAGGAHRRGAKVHVDRDKAKQWVESRQRRAARAAS